MSNPFIAEIRLFAGNFPPRGWAFCHGQLLPIAQNTALFSLVGTTYGGNGSTTFGLPDLRGRAPMQPGNGPGLTPRVLGEKGGAETVTLSAAELPAHTHELRGLGAPATSVQPAGNLPAIPAEDLYQSAGTKKLAPMGAGAVSPAGEGQPHNNVQPSLTLNFIVALTGIFPPRS